MKLSEDSALRRWLDDPDSRHGRIAQDALQDRKHAKRREVGLIWLGMTFFIAVTLLILAWPQAPWGMR